MNAEFSNLNVYYGWSVMNNVRRKISLSVIFENEGNYAGLERRMNSIKRLQNTCYVRKQTVGEAEDGKHQNRILTEYSLFLDDKNFMGNLSLMLDVNLQKDINNVPESILLEIKEALRSSFKKSYSEMPKQNRYAAEN